jgi:alginate O-acetyltransferase complex protein AlgI
MLFNSAQYLVFFLAVLLVSWSLARRPAIRTWFILLASYYFYVSNNHWQIFLLLATTSSDYFVCLVLMRVERPTYRRLLLLVSLVSNLGLLGFFKYTNFLGASVGALAGLIGARLDWVDLNIALPIGISFYTFEALSYTIDVYRRKIPAEPDWSRLAFLVSFFPHLIAGPIVRAASFFPQIGRQPSLSGAQLEEALYLIFTGLVKKVVFADWLATYADAAFAHPGGVNSLQAWVGVYAFSFQIYFDFSGYTDLALGSAKLLGFELPANFRRPYAAVSITDFWRRWHMTLSTWLRDYLYISLGGNRTRTRYGVYRNLMLTMLLGGLWHGAAWHFAIWGGLHGLLLCVERALGVHRAVGDEPIRAPAVKVLRSFLVFNVVTAIWITFRAPSMPNLLALIGKLASGPLPASLTVGTATAIGLMATALGSQFVGEFADIRRRFLDAPVSMKAFAYAACSALILVANTGVPKAFIYFQF